MVLDNYMECCLFLKEILSQKFIAHHKCVQILGLYNVQFFLYYKCSIFPCLFIGLKKLYQKICTNVLIIIVTMNLQLRGAVARLRQSVALRQKL